MSKHDFTRDEFAARRQRVRQEMERRNLDWLLVLHPVSIHWLTGSDAKSYQEFQCLFFPKDDRPVGVLTREGERAEFLADAWVDTVWGYGGGEPADPIAEFLRVARELGIMDQRAGLEVPGFYLHPHHYVRLKEALGGALAEESTTLIPNLKLVKSPAEIAYIREAAAMADDAMVAFQAAVKSGASEFELAGVVYHSLLRAGSGLAASPINLVTGERTAFSHGAPTARRLQSGEFGNIEFGATSHRYTSTIGRQFCLGEPTARMTQLTDIVLRASDAFLAEVRAGAPAVAPHRAAKRLIADEGLDHGRVHLSGYGLAPGFPPSWAEPLQMLDDCAYTLEAGMVITVEPPIFLGDEGLGARIIDNVLVTETGGELLSRFPRDLMIVS